MSDTISEQDSEAKIHALRELLASRGWLLLKEVLRQQHDIRVGGILYEPTTPHGVYQQEFKKGEVATLDLVQKLPDQIIESLQHVKTGSTN